MYSKAFWTLSVSTILFSISFNMIIPKMPDYMAQIGAEGYLGYYIFLFTLAAGIARPYSGRLADTIGRKPVIVIGTLVTTAMSILYPIFHWVVLFLVLRFFHGFSTGFQPTGASAMVSDITPENRRGEAMGVYGIMFNVGSALGMALGGFVALHTGMHSMFYIASGFGLLSLFMLLRVKETLPAAQKKPFNWSVLKLKWEDVVDKQVFYPAFLFILMVFPFGALLTVISQMSDDFSIENKGLYFTFIPLATALVRFFFRKLPDRFGRVNTSILGGVLLLLAMLITQFAVNKFMFLSGGFIYGLGIGFYASSFFAWVLDLALPERKGRALATIFLALEIGIGMGNLVTGWLIDVLQYDLMVSVVVLIVVLGALIQIRIQKNNWYR